MKSFIIIIIPLFSFLLLSSCDNSNDLTGQKIIEEGRAPVDYDGPITRILEDNVHATKQNTTFALTENDFSYSHMYAFNRLFNHLNHNGYEHDRLVSGKLTSELLKNYDILFLNLMDEQKPDFTEEEIEAVESFINNGGGLFVIADHTNVYRHAEKTNPLLAPYGIEIRYEIAVDVFPHSVAGLGWILVQDLKEHPVNEDLIEYSLQTGGPLDGPGGIGYTSEDGWGDLWDPEMKEGFYGNWSKDPDESWGPLSVIQAVQYGEGRVMVTGDQNIFGDPYLFFIDNDGLAFNGFEWLAQREDETTSLRNRRPLGLNIRVDTKSDDLSMAKAGGSGHYTFYVNLNRVQEVTAHATRTPLPFTPDVTMAVAPVNTIDASTINEMESVLQDGGQVVFAANPSYISSAAQDFLNYWQIDFNLETSDGSPLNILEESIEIPSLFEITTIEQMRRNNLSFSSCHAIQCPGHAIVSAMDTNDNSCDLICEYEIENGRLLLVFSSNYLKNSCLGGEHDVPHNNPDEDNYSESCYYFELGLTDLLLEY
ncbi:MAG: hypothetical protein PF689_05150 [Deltaproteobacteria bacterium]|jgi:hypothetical protein|nr:hypothetical protein [Deltaproteobacteria bacterium]